VSLLQRWRSAATGIAAALLVIVIAATPGGRDATARFLAQFRSGRLEAVPLTTMQLQNLGETFAQLEQIGTVEGLDTLADDPARAASIAEAERIAGFPVALPDPATLPAGYDSTPAEIRVVRASRLRLTFDEAKARAYYQSSGRENVRLPEGFDGASLVVETPAAVLLQYARASDGGGGFSLPLLIGQSGALTVTIEGDISFGELREGQFGLPGLSPETVRQLNAISSGQTPLPIPVPVDQIDWQRTTVAGAPGLQLGDDSGLGSVVVWQRDGRIYGVGGAASAEEIHRVADSIR
jgi:hypothetical protein